MSALQRMPRSARSARKVTPARRVAWEVLRRTFDEDAWTDRAFAAEAAREELSSRDRAFAQWLAYGSVQAARRLDHVIATVGKRPLRKIDTPVLHALRLGAYELLHGGADSGHAAVSQAVELVRATMGERAVAFANAVLRRAQVDASAILAQLDRSDKSDLATLLSYPEWIVRRLRDTYGEDGVEALVAQNGPPAWDDGEGPRAHPFRINSLHPRAADAAALLADTGLEASHTGGAFAGALPEARLVHGATGALSGLVDDGLLIPQSLSSMLVARAVDPAPGERLLDACSAPGGKTLHMAALMGGRGSILACDLHESRAASVEDLAARAHAAHVVEVRAVDATALVPSAEGMFDRVLVDAPCSGLGVLDRRPDARWKRREESVAELATLQRRLLGAAAQLLRPGGVLVYSTCTMLPEENEQVVEDVLRDGFAQLAPDPLPDTLPRHLLLPQQPHLARVWPHLHGSDGFFVARMRKGDAQQ